jgi:hypothetical protein
VGIGRSPVARWPLTVTVSGAREAFSPSALVVGADRRFYVNGCAADGKTCNIILAVTTNGNITQYTTKSRDAPDGGLALGPDGNVGFTESLHIAKITPLGAVTEFAYRDHRGPSAAGDTVASGADGNVWFTRATLTPFPKAGIIKLTVSTGKMTLYPDDDYEQALWLTPVAGQLYFGMLDGNSSSEFYYIHSIAANGKFGQVLNDQEIVPGRNFISPGDGNLWWIPYQRAGQRLSLTRLSTTNGTFTHVQTRFPSGDHGPIALGPGRYLWSTIRHYFIRYGPLPTGL